MDLISALPVIYKYINCRFHVRHLFHMGRTFLISPAGDIAGAPSRHQRLRCGQTNGADLLGHVDWLGQVHQGDVVGDIGLVLFIDKALVADDSIHVVASLRRGNVQG